MNGMPDKINIKGRKFNLIKEYKHFGLYEDSKTKIKECFLPHDLGMIKSLGRIVNISPNKVRR